MVIPCEKYAYAYIEFKDGLPTYKIYQPFSENYKWLNNHDRLYGIYGVNYLKLVRI